MLSASVDEEDRGEEEKDDEAAEGGDKDDSGVWRERSRSENQFGSWNLLMEFIRTAKKSQTTWLQNMELPHIT